MARNLYTHFSLWICIKPTPRRIAAGFIGALLWTSVLGQTLTNAPSGTLVETRKPLRQPAAQKAVIIDTGIGVDVQDVNRSIASSFGLGPARGALVVSLIQGSPAYVAGVQVGDIFLSLGNAAVRDGGHLTQLLASHAPGSSVTAQVWRTPYPIPLTINLPADKESVSREQKTMPMSTRVAGLIVRELSHADLCRAGVKNGLLVESSEGPAAAAGIREGALILRMNAVPLTRIEDLYSLLGERGGSEVALLVNQGGQTRFVSLAVPPKRK